MKAEHKAYTLIGPDRKPYQSITPGTLGGNRKGKIYGRLDCRAAISAIEKWGTTKERVFFADEQTAIAAGYRPCGSCMREKYAIWKEEKQKEGK
ncbi:Ada metal-binding domain-containing protein [Neobacillus drentensis]|uniref:Ada metal-binding domain-containing protein n=1 Tax=Neobacillus drentensis TaxID=220684 RepID=UPI000826FD77|nr:Ada metal-binding domain-containing protein [Neobacillus drentensis]